MTFQRGAECPPAAEVERHAVGESVEEKWRSHIETCGSCGAYVKDVKGSSVAFVQQRPAELFMRQVERRQRQQPVRAAWLTWIFAGAGTLALASLALIVAPSLIATDEVRFKGGAVEVYVKRGLLDPQRLLDGATVKPGDTLRFRYRGEQAAHLAVIEQDGAGAVTVFAPFQGTHSVELKPEEFFADAVAVDDTAGAAKLYVIQRARRIELTSLVETIRGFGEPSCEGCVIELLRYEKTP